MEQIDNKTDMQSALADTEQVLWKLGIRPGMGLESSSQALIYAMKAGKVGLDGFKKYKASLLKIASITQDADRPELKDARNAYKTLLIFSDGMEVGAREAANLIKAKLTE